MTPEAQQIAIAEAHGWTHPVDLAENGKTQDGSQWWTKGDNKLTRNLPDYLNDLNAMHEAEKVLDGNEIQAEYAQVVIEVLNRDHHGEPRFLGASQFRQIHATATQRAEAFLKTLGLWKD